MSFFDVGRLGQPLRYATMREFDRRTPFSAAGTDMVLRAFAAHPGYGQSEPTLTAARLLASKLAARLQARSRSSD